MWNADPWRYGSAKPGWWSFAWTVWILPSSLVMVSWLGDPRYSLGYWNEMRPAEIVLCLGNLLVFFILAIPPLRATGWMGYFAPLTVLLAGIQLLVEGPRWEMIPAYALAIILFLIWLVVIVMPGGITIHVNPVIAGVGLGLSALALVVSIVLPIALPVFQFPRPTGPHQIGTVTYYWMDSSRHEIFSADSSARRELMVQVWYPAEANPSSARAPYVQDASALSRAWRGSYICRGSLSITSNTSLQMPLHLYPWQLTGSATQC